MNIVLIILHPCQPHPQFFSFLVFSVCACMCVCACMYMRVCMYACVYISLLAAWVYTNWFRHSMAGGEGVISSPAPLLQFLVQGWLVQYSSALLGAPATALALPSPHCLWASASGTANLQAELRVLVPDPRRPAPLLCHAHSGCRVGGGVLTPHFEFSPGPLHLPGSRPASPTQGPI